MSGNVKKPRRAVSLVELLVVLSASSVVLTMSAALVHRMMHTQSKARAYFDVERSALRLSNQFRRDVHQAGGAVVNAADRDEGVLLRLELPDGKAVEYHELRGNVVRLLIQDDNIQSREEFQFPATADLSIREEGLPRRLICLITSQPEEYKPGAAVSARNPPPLPVSLQVEARLGRDVRHALATSNQGERNE